MAAYEYSHSNKVCGVNGLFVGAADSEIQVTSSTGGLYQSGTLITSTAAELNKLDGFTGAYTDLNYIDVAAAGTLEASKAIVVDANLHIDAINVTTLSIGASGSATAVTSTAAELNALDGFTGTYTDLNYIDVAAAGTLEASKAIVVDASKKINELFIEQSSASTDGGTSVEGMTYAMTMTGAGGVGGRAKFSLTTNVGLGGWSNALKGEVTYGATGKTAGLGSAIVGEMTLSAGTVDGTYAPLELELNLGSGAAVGTQSSLIYASVNGADASTFDATGKLLSLNGVTIGSGNLVQAAAVTDVDSTHALKIAINGTDYFIPLNTSASFA